MQDRIDEAEAYVARVSEEAVAIDVTTSSANRKLVAIDLLGEGCALPIEDRTDESG